MINADLKIVKRIEQGIRREFDVHLFSHIRGRGRHQLEQSHGAGMGHDFIVIDGFLPDDGMDKKTLVEAVPTQVVEIVYPSKAEKKDEDTLFAKGELQVYHPANIEGMPDFAMCSSSASAVLR